MTRLSTFFRPQRAIPLFAALVISSTFAFGNDDVKTHEKALVEDKSQHANPLPSRMGDAFTDANNPIRKIFDGERLDLWSLKKPVVDESILDVKRGSATDATGHLVPDMIDRLIRKRLTEAGITPSAQADRRTLIRRLSFDLTGLPPTPDEVRRFIQDSSPNAYESLVDRMLDSSRYGERWARHWLDVVRYADTEGFERDEFRPLAWQYRDYVIRSFNQDKPFDQFIREQLADTRHAMARRRMLTKPTS